MASWGLAPTKQLQMAHDYLAMGGSVWRSGWPHISRVLIVGGLMRSSGIGERAHLSPILPSDHTVRRAPPLFGRAAATEATYSLTCGVHLGSAPHQILRGAPPRLFCRH